jgi:lipopolysaccharide export system protein LptA
MEKTFFNRALHVFCGALSALALLAAPVSAAPQEKAAAGDKVQITADRLISDNGGKIAEFTGNVRAVQGDTVITAESLKIFFKDETDAKNPAGSQESIREIVAAGKVRIKFDARLAEAEKAVYSAETQILLLTGPGSKISDGASSITGSRITLYRLEDRIAVESGKEGRVEAVLFTQEKGLK